MKKKIIGLICILISTTLLITTCRPVNTLIDNNKNVKNVFLNEEPPSSVIYSNTDSLFIPEINRRVPFESINLDVKWNTTFGKIDDDFEHLVQPTIDFEHVINAATDLSYGIVEGMQQPAIYLTMEVSTDGITWSDTASVNYGDTMYFLLSVTNTGNMDLSDVIVYAPRGDGVVLVYNNDANPPPAEITASLIKWDLGALLVGQTIWMGYSITSYYPAMGGDFEVDFPALAEGYYSSSLICGDDTYVHLIFKEIVFSLDLTTEVSTDGITWSDTASVNYGDTMCFLLTVTNTGNMDLSDIIVYAPNGDGVVLVYNNDANPPPAEITASLIKWDLGALPAGLSLMIGYTITSYYPAMGGDFEVDFPALTEGYYNSSLICGDINYVHLIFKETVFSLDLTMEVSPDGITWNDEATVCFGNPLYFRMTVTNTGNVDFSYVKVMAGVPPEVIIDAIIPYIVNSSGYPEWNISIGLPVGYSIPITFIAYAIFGYSEYEFSSYALGYLYPYPGPIAQALDSASVIIIPPTIDLVKEVSTDFSTWSDHATVYFDDPVIFRLTVTNTGCSHFYYVHIIDVFPPGFIIGASLPYIVNSDGYPEWNISVLPAGESREIYFAANASLGVGVADIMGGAIGYVYLYPNPAAIDTDSVSVTIRQPLPDISVLKKVSADGITYSGSGVTVYKTNPVYFKITVTNTGNTDLSYVGVFDTLPSFLTYNDDANLIPDSITGSTIGWDLGTLPEGDMVVITFSATASVVGEDDNKVNVSGVFRTTPASDTDLAHIIVENIPPVADFSYSPLNPTDLDLIQFTDTSYDLAGSIVNWTWSFGDGSISYQQDPTYQYSDDGTYTVTLKVTDDDNAYDELSTQLIVLNVPPVADPNGPYAGTTEYPNLTFDGSYSYDLDGSIVYDWDFGDGSTGTGQNPSHNYAKVGTYTVTLMVTDDDGDTDTATTTATISINPPTITLNYPKDGEILKDKITIQWFAFDSKDGKNVDIYIYYTNDNGKHWMRLHDDSLDNTGEYLWDTTGVTDGLYRLLVEAVDSNNEIGYDSSRFQIKNHEEPPVNNAPMKPNQPSGVTNGKIHQEYAYTTSTTDPDGDQIYYFWDWGDGNISGWLGPYTSGSLCEAKHTWNTKNNYNIKVKAKDIYGKESVWSDPLPVTMPYAINNPLQQILNWLFQRFPNAFPLLRHLLGY